MRSQLMLGQLKSPTTKVGPLSLQFCSMLSAKCVIYFSLLQVSYTDDESVGRYTTKNRYFLREQYKSKHNNSRKSDDDTLEISIL